MDISFTCHSCNQALEADDGMSGSQIACPSCGTVITVPGASDSSRGAGFGRKLTMAAVQAPPSASIAKGRSALEVQAKAAIRVRLRTIRRADCIMNGKDRFDETVSELLQSLGEGHLISVHPIHYTQIDPDSKQPVADYGVMVVYRS
jgi:hypothetical protein